MMDTNDGQVQILEDAYKKVQKGKASPDVQAALRNALIQIQTQTQNSAQIAGKRLTTLV